jgi:hypothetical protein
MRPGRVFVVTAALALATATSALPTQVASAQAPSTQVLVPSNGATVGSNTGGGNPVVLDASASAGVTQVQFELTGGILNDLVIATATPTIYGWIALWNSTNVVDGTYTLQSVATAGGSSGTSPGISINVSNGHPIMSFVLPPPGGTVSGTQAVFDAVGPAGVTGVAFVFSAPGCPPTGPPLFIPLCTFSATPTLYGWIAVWDINGVPNGTYLLKVVCGQCDLNNLTSTAVVVDNPTMVLPTNGDTVSGSQGLDCVPPPGYVGVQFFIDGMNGTQSINATPTLYGWLGQWNTTAVPNGIYNIDCSASSSGGNAFSPIISVTVAN